MHYTLYDLPARARVTSGRCTRFHCGSFVLECRTAVTYNWIKSLVWVVHSDGLDYCLRCVCWAVLEPIGAVHQQGVARLTALLKTDDPDLLGSIKSAMHSHWACY
jgi:hypothetical protein